MIERISLITAIYMFAILVVRWFELKRPIGPNLPHPEVRSDWAAVFTNLLLAEAVALLCVPSVMVVGWVGGGLIHIPTDGWWYLPSLIGFILVGDLYRYGIHRMQHRIPFLWAMHSFHHSANALTYVTGGRHFWLERVMFDFFPFAMFFTVPIDMATIISLVHFLPDGCSHLNVRLSMGRYISWINNPQWHRIHHSVQPEHHNKNFASLLPLWDIVFGTAWIPGRDEYPATGLVPSERVGVIDSVMWPLRSSVRRFTAVHLGELRLFRARQL
jgi:sterol desaturase/sphingolipid hydroxylase (fatty acid hydroxylase superfamily)